MFLIGVFLNNFFFCDQAVHRTNWRAASSELALSGNNLVNYRTKLDLFLFRMRSQLTSVRACSNAAECRGVQVK